MIYSLWFGDGGFQPDSVGLFHGAGYLYDCPASNNAIVHIKYTCYIQMQLRIRQ